MTTPNRPTQGATAVEPLFGGACAVEPVEPLLVASPGADAGLSSVVARATLAKATAMRMAKEIFLISMADILQREGHKQ